MSEEKKFNPDDYWEKRLTKKKGLEGVGYTRLGSYFNKWAYKVRRHVFEKLVKENKIAVEKSRVLDIGSGSGFYINIWKGILRISIILYTGQISCPSFFISSKFSE